jgi:ribonuclease P protein component
MVVLPRRDDGARLGMAISRRHARRAVERSRIKRLVRETFRQHRATLPPVDVVVMLRGKAAGVPNAVLRDGLQRLWRLLEERNSD